MVRRRKSRTVVLAASLATILWISSPAAAAARDERTDKLVLGVLPIISPERLARWFQPLANYLSAQIGVRVVMETAPDYTTFIARTAQKGRYDLLFTAPHFYYLAQRKSGYRAVVRVAGKPLSAVVAVLSSKPVYKLDDLRGGTLAVPDRLSLAALLIRETLLEKGLTPGQDIGIVETPTHNASLMSAVKGFTDAAGLMAPPFEREGLQIRNQMRVIEITVGTPQMPFSVAPWLPAEQTAKFSRAMLEMEESEAGRALLEHLQWPGLVAARPEEYDIFAAFAVQIEIR